MREVDIFRDLLRQEIKNTDLQSEIKERLWRRIKYEQIKKEKKLRYKIEQKGESYELYRSNITCKTR